MTHSAALQQHGLQAAATIRRSFAAFNQEITEFSLAAQAGSREQMDVARRKALDHIECYFDAVAAAHELGRNDCGHG